MEKNTIILLVAGGAALIVFCTMNHYLGSKNTNNSTISSKIANFVYMGSPYTPTAGGSRGEVSEECLQHPGYRMCMLTDGTSGVCGTSGMCVTDMEMDIKRNWTTRDNIKMPLCSQPIFKEGCQRFCKCKQLKNTIDGGILAHEMDDCVEGCRNMFYPI